VTDTITIGTNMVQDSAPMPKSLISAQSYSGGLSVVTESVARKQDAEDRINTRAVLAISEDKPAGVAEDGAGYLIHEWHALRDQARRMII
jgi:hypothetical protein